MPRGFHTWPGGREGRWLGGEFVAQPFRRLGALGDLRKALRGCTTLMLRHVSYKWAPKTRWACAFLATGAQLVQSAEISGLRR